MLPVLSPNPHTPKGHLQNNRSESPNYFGLVFDQTKPTAVGSGSRTIGPSWSPSTASIRSAAANSPQKVTASVTSEFEAFRRSSQHKTFTLNQAGSLSNYTSASRKPSLRPASNQPNNGTGISDREPKSLPLALKKEESADKNDASRQPRSPKRLLSDDSRSILDEGRHESPVSMTESDARCHSGSPPFRQGDKLPRLSPPKDLSSMSMSGLSLSRGDTLPTHLDHETPSMTTPQNVVNIMKSAEEEVLLLDLRVSTQYAKSRIPGALNLCIPTTLLKRATYDVSRLAETFKNGAEKERFQRWRSCKWIIVYDASSSQMKEAANCINVLKKFPKDGWNGNSCIIRGGFNDMVKKFPNLIVEGDGTNANSATGLSTTGAMGDIPPVIGGCPMPITKNAANPFFGNIRQNMDLIGGVGQMPIKMSEKMALAEQVEIPVWLHEAAAEADGGKTVSDKFLHIEQREQKRMQEALSANVVYGTPNPDAGQKIQIAGIEKGSKNRYNNIWPYEHSRVKLKDAPRGTCDYVNANFVRTTRSNKKYIATQGPIPATFNDFWNMVWQRDIRVIVMLTAEAEGGQIKAHNYWSDKTYGALRLNFLSEHRASLDADAISRHRNRSATNSRKTSVAELVPAPDESEQQRASYFARPSTASSTTNSSTNAAADKPYVTVRRFTLAHEHFPFQRMREITQLQYSNWPDFGAPAHPAHLLGLVEQCDAVVRSTSSKHAAAQNENQPVGAFTRPVLVHCSAGCGRTGTFCTVDSVVDMLKRQRQARATAAAAATLKTSSVQQHVGGHGSAPAQLKFGADSSGDDDDDDADNDDDDNGEGAFRGLVKHRGTKDNLDWLQRDDIDLIEATVEEFRLQRLSMVQSLRQFVLCYESALEWIASQSHGRVA